MRTALPLLASWLAFAGCPRRSPIPAEPDAESVGERIAEYRAAALDPARLPPLSLSSPVATATSGDVRATARVLRPEEAEWNRWPDGGARLFNDAAALLFVVRVEGTGPLRWVPAATRLELNDERTSILAASSGEPLLGDLLVNAYLEERFGLDGDLVDRARGAGPYRAAYLPLTSDGGVLEGLVAFPLIADGRSVADLHVVALRLTLGVVGDADGAHTLVFVFS